MKRHKWNGIPQGNTNDYQAGMAVYCKKCGMVKEYVRGRLTYFLDDTVKDRAGNCDERLENA